MTRTAAYFSPVTVSRFLFVNKQSAYATNNSSEIETYIKFCIGKKTYTNLTEKTSEKVAVRPCATTLPVWTT